MGKEVEHEQGACFLCRGEAGLHAMIQEVHYFACPSCDFIFADPALLRKVDAGEPLRQYDANYWSAEMDAARSLSFGSSLARVAEALLYCQLPVERFVDIGTGPGFLLDALSIYLPAHTRQFHGVEKYPPAEQYRSRHPNYIVADLSDCDSKFECGVCIEVIEHLTPAMAAHPAAALGSVSVPGSLFLFNTGLTDYVLKEDLGYLDPFGRGHITSWSVEAARKIFNPCGFAVHALPGKTWAFLVEKPIEGGEAEVSVTDRIWTAPEQNRKMLTDSRMGDVMYILGLESARAYV